MDIMHIWTSGRLQLTHVTQVPIGCCLGHEIVFYGIKLKVLPTTALGEGLDRACTRRSHNIAYSIFSVTYRLVLFTVLPRMIGRNNAKVSECLQALSTAGKCCAH